MRRDQALAILAAHRQEISTFGITSLALFGSVARDEARAESDVDILVEFQGPATFDRYLDLKFYLEELLSHSVDLVTRRALKPALRPQIAREAVYVT